MVSNINTKEPVIKLGDWGFADTTESASLSTNLGSPRCDNKCAMCCGGGGGDANHSRWSSSLAATRHQRCCVVSAMERLWTCGVLVW